MADIKKYSPPWDLRKRALRDHARHEKKIKEAIKKNLKKLIIEESVITSQGGKKVKIPMRYLDQYRFRTGKNKKQKAIGHGDGQIGQPIGYDKSMDPNPDSRPTQPGDRPGEDMYTAEVDLDDIVKIMAEDLDLPWLENKKKQKIKSEVIEFSDISRKGAIPNLDLKRTLFENIKRNAAKGNPVVGGFEQDDLRFKTWETTTQYHSSACVYMILDKSASLSEGQMYVIKSFFFWTARLLKQKYEKLDFIFIAHDTQARIVPEDEFFKFIGSGGTKCSSALQLALAHMKEYRPASQWNNYVFAFSDGENWMDDNDLYIKLIKELLQHCRSVGYGEVEYSNDFYGIPLIGGSSFSRLYDHLIKNFKHNRFISARIVHKDEVYETIKKFLNEGEYGEGKENN